MYIDRSESMKRHFIIYTLAAFCATAILSCNKEVAIDNIGPDTECTVFLTASIDASTKAVGIDESKVVSTWTVGDVVELVLGSDKTIISNLKVISVSGNKAQLSGKVSGIYAKNTEMYLYYGGHDYDYSGQTGTAESAVSKAYLMAETKIKAIEGKSLYLENVTMEHQQAYMGLFFYYEDSPFKVKSVVIKAGGENIIKTQLLDGTETTYDGTEKFTVVSPSAEGQEVFYFALRDAATSDHPYTLEITATDSKVYTGEVASAPTLTENGNYFADSKVVLVRLSSVITPPSIYTYITYDTHEHTLIEAAEVRLGTTAYYCVSDTYPAVNYAGWSTSLPKASAVGSYKVWYRVDGGRNYESILPTYLGTVEIINPTP